MSTKIHIALADDEALFRRGMRLILEDYEDMEVIIEAEHGADLLAKIRASPDLPDVLLLDLKMPVMGGIEAAKIIREQFPSIHFIILSSHVNPAFILNMIEIGAAAYLGKSAHPDEVVETILSVRDKGFCYNETVMQVIRDNLTGKIAPKPPAGFEVGLTNREMEVLLLICNQFTTPEIAERLFLSTRTVDGHRNNMLSKLGCRNTAGLVVYGIQHGLVKPDPEQFKF